MSNAIHYFVDTNASQGFTSFFQSNFSVLNNIIKLENYPGTLVEDIVGKICDRAEERGYELEIIHNCLDNHVEGVILPQFKSGLMNIPAYVDYGLIRSVACWMMNRYRKQRSICSRLTNIFRKRKKFMMSGKRSIFPT